MTQDERTGAVLDYYNAHPISEQQILEKLQRDGLNSKDLTEDILQNYDQDHYGGTDANDALAELAGLRESDHVLDVCCGLGGPSRYLAHKYDCRVTGIDLTESRIVGARRLTEMTRLDGRVDFQTGNALSMPFADASFDVLISQEAFCHIPDKGQLVAECARVTKPGGRFAFTDILVTPRVTEDIRTRLLAGMAFQELNSTESYAAALDREGFEVVKVQDLAEPWRIILSERLKMYRGLKDQTVERYGQAHFDKWDSAYSFFVGLYETGELSGGRFLARRRPST